MSCAVLNGGLKLTSLIIFLSPVPRLMLIYSNRIVDFSTLLLTRNNEKLQFQFETYKTSRKYINVKWWLIGVYSSNNKYISTYFLMKLVLVTKHYNVK